MFLANTVTKVQLLGLYGTNALPAPLLQGFLDRSF